MPTYDYHCRKCGHQFEAIVPPSAAQVRKCPACGKRTAKRQFPAPAIKTSATFLGGVGTLRQQCGDDEGETKRLMEAAKANGARPGMNDFYCPGIARTVGDPEAFVPHDDPVGHIKRLCKKRRMGLRGRIEIPDPDPLPPPPRVPLADDMIADTMRGRIEQDPSLAHKGKAGLRKLREEIIDNHSYKLSE